MNTSKSTQPTWESLLHGASAAAAEIDSRPRRSVGRLRQFGRRITSFFASSQNRHVADPQSVTTERVVDQTFEDLAVARQARIDAVGDAAARRGAEDAEFIDAGTPPEAASGRRAVVTPLVHDDSLWGGLTVEQKIDALVNYAEVREAGSLVVRQAVALPDEYAQAA